MEHWRCSWRVICKKMTKLLQGEVEDGRRLQQEEVEEGRRLQLGEVEDGRRLQGDRTVQKESFLRIVKGCCT